MPAPNYARPSLDADTLDRLKKPVRGAALLAREAERLAAEADERREKAIAKKRDGRCRWPEPHKCRGGDEAAHIVDASLGGACIASNLVTLCPWLHRRGPESIHGKQVKVEAETERGAFGPLSFWRQTGAFDALGQPNYYLVKREIRPFEYERD